jgi:hypothetical protein
MMEKILNLSEFPNRLASLKPNNWKPLIDLIPIIKNTKPISYYPEVKEEIGIIQMPYIIEAKVVRDFHDLIYSIGIIIDYDWVNWDEGRQIVNGGIEEISNLNLLTICKLITVIVRSARFSESELANFFESGFGLAVLKE